MFKRLLTLTLLKLLTDSHTSWPDQRPPFHSSHYLKMKLHWSTPMPKGNCPFLVSLQEEQKGGPEIAFPVVGPRKLLCIKLDSVQSKRQGHGHPGSQRPPHPLTSPESWHSLGIGSCREDATGSCLQHRISTCILHVIRLLEIIPIGYSFRRWWLSVIYTLV